MPHARDSFTSYPGLEPFREILEKRHFHPGSREEEVDPKFGSHYRWYVY